MPGIHTSTGYLLDADGAFRLGLTLREINYHDIFSRNQVGMAKFEALLQVFDSEYVSAIR